MGAFDKINEYKEIVCNQIRWKRIHEPIAKELEAHMIDQMNYYLDKGVTEEEAVEKTILEMGDPVAIGTELDRVHRPKSQKSMILFTLLLMIIGMLIQVIFIKDCNYSFNLHSQLPAIIIGTVLMFIVYFGDFTIIGKYPKLLFMSYIIFTFIVLMLSIEVNGNPYFYSSTGIAFTLSHITLLFPIILTGIIYSTRKNGIMGIIYTDLTIAGLSILALIISTKGYAFLFLLTGTLLLGTAIYKNWYPVKEEKGFLLMIIPHLILTVYIFLKEKYILIDRLALAIHPEIDANGKGWRGAMIKELVHSAKFIGKAAISEDIQEPALQIVTSSSDFMLTYLIAHIGWISFYIILFVFAAFMIRGFWAAFKQRNILGLLVSLAVMITLTLEGCNYIAWNLGIMLIDPITLPLISYGNVALVINMLMIGIMLSVYRTDSIYTDMASSTVKLDGSKGQFIQWNNGCLTIDFKKYKNN